MVGKTISHYRILEKLGEGGMGAVYKAEDTRLKRTVALKFLSSQPLGTADEKTRFAREAQAAAALDHPNICTVYEIDEADGHTFIAMALVEGQSLREMVEAGPLELDSTLRLAAQIARGLQAAHEKGIVHRDIKSANIMVTQGGNAKITDFGLARLAGTTQVTRTGVTVGTVSYMSPEQAKGESVDHRSDIWSFGVVLYELVTGGLPFKGEHEQAVGYQVVHEEARAVTSVRSGVPIELERIVTKCLEKDPRNRYQHIDEVLVDLRKVRSGNDVKPGRKLNKYALPGLLVFAVVLLLVILNPFHIELQKGRPVEAAGNTIGVMGFENLSDPEDSEHLGRMLTGLIVTDLAETGGIPVLSTSRVLVAYKEAGGRIDGAFDGSLAAETARRAGVRTMLAGQVIQTGQGLLLTAELVDVQSGQTLGSIKREAASTAELFRLAGAMAADVRVRLGLEPEPSGRASLDLARALTDSPAAYRQFVAGELALHQEDYGQAVSHFRDAVTSDSTFALAWYRLSMAYDWQGDTDASAFASARAVQFSDKLPARWQAMCRAKNDHDTGNVDQAYERLTRLLTSATDLPDAHYQMAEIATHFSRYMDAQKARVHLEEALAIDPTYEIVLDHLVRDCFVAGDMQRVDQIGKRSESDQIKQYVLFYQGRYEELLAPFETRTRGAPREVILALMQRGQWERALALVDWEVRHQTGYQRALSMIMRGTLHCARGRFGAGLSDYQQALPDLENKIAVRLYANDARLCTADLLALTGDVEGALAVVREAEASDPFDPRPYFWRGELSAAAGNHSAAAEALADLRAMSEESMSPWPEYWIHVLAGELHRAEGRWDEALSELDMAMPLRSTSPQLWDMGGIIRARVLIQGGYEGAVAACERVIDNPSLTTYWTNPLLTRVIATHFELGRLLEKEGNPVAARGHYETYVDCWGEADTPIPDVAVARERLKALGSP